MGKKLCGSKKELLLPSAEGIYSNSALNTSFVVFGSRVVVEGPDSLTGYQNNNS